MIGMRGVRRGAAVRAMVIAVPALALGGCGVGLIGVIAGAALGGGGGGGGSPATTSTVPGSPGLLSFDTFEGGLADWRLVGSPPPATTTGGNPGSALLPGGTATTNGEAVTDDVFRVAPGLTITADLQVSALSTANTTIWVGLRSNTSADGVLSLDAGVLLVSATGQRQFFLNGGAVFADTLPDTNWHNFQVVIRTDCRVEFYVDGVLVHATTGQLQGGGLWRPVTVGGRSVGATTLADNIYVTGTPPTAQVDFAHGLEGSLTGMYTLGSQGGAPVPSIDSFLQGQPAPSLNPGGNAAGNGEAQTVQRFDMGNGPLELRAALRVPALTTANAQVWFGLDRGSVSTTADGVRDLAAGVHLQAETSDIIEYIWFDGAPQSVSESLDTNWHVFQVIVRPDRFVEFFRDGLLVFTSTTALPAALGQLPVSVGGRSSGAAARADNLAVISPGFGHAVTGRQLTPGGTAPAARSGHRAIHDPVADAMIVFGGYDGSQYYNDLQCLLFSNSAGNGSWILLSPTGTAPAARERHGQVWDANRQRMLMFGGTDGTSMYGDVHAVNLGGPGALAWTALTPGGTGPTGLSDAAVIFDATNDRLVAFGGFDGSSLQSTVWALQFSPSSVNGVWSTLSPGGTAPSARDRCVGIYDGEAQRMLIAGGNDGFGGGGGEFWTLTLRPGSEAWVQLSPNGVSSPPQPLTAPAGRQETALAGWTAERRAFMFGGYDPNGATLLPPTGTANEVWALDLGCGTATPNGYFAGGPGTTWPAPRQLHSMIWHPAGRRLVVFGGDDASGNFFNDAWELRLP